MLFAVVCTALSSLELFDSYVRTLICIAIVSIFTIPVDFNYICLDFRCLFAFISSAHCFTFIWIVRYNVRSLIYTSIFSIFTIYVSSTYICLDFEFLFAFINSEHCFIFIRIVRFVWTIVYMYNYIVYINYPCWLLIALIFKFFAIISNVHCFTFIDWFLTYTGVLYIALASFESYV